MEDKLRLNNKLFDFNGVIGRRDYFLNIIIINSISLFFTLPYIFAVTFKAEKVSDYFNLSNMFMQTSMFIKFWFLTGMLITIALSVSNYFRRINDINGNVNIVNNVLFSIILALNCFSFLLFPFLFSLILCGISFVISLFLIFKKGKVTGNYPYDVTKIFNWGAFLGSWIWGLFNNSYIPLLTFIIGYTPWGFLFSIYCGLKGNEWAYKNRKWDDVETFNKSQRKQATIWTVIDFVIFPFIVVALSVVLIAFSAMVIGSDSEKDGTYNPQKTEQKIEKLNNMVIKVGSIYFESYKIEQNENKFYILTSDWRGYSYSDRKKLFDMAAQVAAAEKNKASRKNNPNPSREYYTKSKELPKTKIYSANTNKLLAEFKIDEADIKRAEENNSIINAVKIAMDSYRFYNE